MENNNLSISQASLQDVHKEVITALVPEKVMDGVELPSMNNDAGFREFMSKLVKVGVIKVLCTRRNTRK
jgi:hypothetical protein